MSLQIGTVARRLAIKGARNQLVDLNSIITGDISSLDWQFPGDGTAIQVFPYIGSDGTFQDLYQLNPNANAPAHGRATQLFGAPCTHCALTWANVSEANGKSIRITVYAADGVTVIAQQVYALTPAAQTLVLDVPGMAVNNLQALKIEVNEAGQQAQPVGGRMTLAPVNGTGTFANTFARIRADRELRRCSYGREFRFSANWPWTNPASEFEVLTDAPRMAVAMVGTAGGAELGILIERRPYQNFTAINGASQFGYEDFVLASPAIGNMPAGSAQRVTVRDDLGAQNQGNVIAAIYVPWPTGTLEIPRPYSNARAVIYGDSIAQGVGATLPLLQGWPYVLRSYYPGEVFLETYNGRSLFADTNGGTFANELALAQTLAQAEPTDLIWEMGVNDYVNAQWSAAAYGASAGRVIDMMLQRFPGLRVWVIGMITRGAGEGANGLGDTLPNFRSQLIGVAQAAQRQPNCTYIDGTAAPFPGAGQLVDGTHPSTVGHGGYAQGVIAAMGL